jgi:hypothetical protein
MIKHNSHEKLIKHFEWGWNNFAFNPSGTMTYHSARRLNETHATDVRTADCLLKLIKVSLPEKTASSLRSDLCRDRSHARRPLEHITLSKQETRDMERQSLPAQTHKDQAPASTSGSITVSRIHSDNWSSHRGPWDDKMFLSHRFQFPNLVNEQTIRSYKNTEHAMRNTKERALRRPQRRWRGNTRMNLEYI